MYIWQHHTTVPLVEKVTVYIDWRQETLRMLLAWTQTRSEANLNPRRFLQHSQTIFDAKKTDLECADITGFHVLLSIIATLCEDNCTFRDTGFRRLAQMVRLLFNYLR